MSGKGHRAYNRAPTREKLRKGRKFLDRETRSILLMLDLKDDQF